MPTLSQKQFITEPGVRKENLVTPLKNYDKFIGMSYIDPMEDLFKEVFKQATKMSENHPSQAIAATYMAIAMRLYKTALSKGQYDEMIQFILDTDVDPFDKPTFH